mgnify:CR=1 FL=1
MQQSHCQSVEKDYIRYMKRQENDTLNTQLTENQSFKTIQGKVFQVLTSNQINNI